MFVLPYRFCTPDVLFEQELKQKHEYLLAMGLCQLSLSSLSMHYVLYLKRIYIKNSTYDLMALSLAKQECCPLLTGDKALREASKKENVIVKGTIWILEQLIIHQQINKQQALNALELMEHRGRRIPFVLAKQLILDL